MVEVPLTQGKVALIDDEDAERVLAHKWCAVRARYGQIWYARRSVRVNGKSKPLTMHRFILDPPPELQVDHINRNGLDNRRSNLRLATNAQNHRNKPIRLGPTGFRGVEELKRGGFRARITVNGRFVRVGPFNTAEDAARAYDLMAKHYHGEFATLNFRD